MRAPAHKVPEEQWLLDRANAQYGLLRDTDLVGRLGRNAVASRRRTCRLTPVGRGVYAFGHTVLRDEGTWLAALWTTPGAPVLSHLTAAAFHGWTLPESEPGPEGDDVSPMQVHVSTTSYARSHGEIAVHRVRQLEPVDTFRRAPFRVTTQPRTLVDLADLLTWAEFRAVADGLRSIRLDKVREAQARAPNRVGAPRVTRLIEADDAHTRSEFERRFLRFLKAQRIPAPDHLNHPVAGHRADCVFAAASLVVELDGRAYHQRRGQMRADRQRDIDYQLAGHHVMRLVWDDLHADEAPRTAGLLRRMLRV